MSRLRLVILLLVLGTLVVYLPVSHHGFSLYDDNDYVTENPMVQHGLTWNDIQWAFTSWYAANWHPVTWLSHMLDCQLFNLTPGGHHDVNVLFHIANTVLLLVLLLRLTGTIWPSAFVAALFAWHPLHVESVAWVSERKDVLSTFFALLTLLCYAKYVIRDKGQGTGNANIKSPAIRHMSRHYWLALFFFALALMSKPMFVTLPFVMLLLDFWPLGRFRGPGFGAWGKLVLEKIPFFVLVIASCVVTFLAQKHGGAVIPLEKIPLGLRVENMLVAYASYLQKIFWPAHLAVFYPFPPAISNSALAISVIPLVCISAIAWFNKNRYPYLLAGWLWFLGTLVPVIGLVQVGSAAMADRYTYFPSIGIFLAVTLGIRDASAKFHVPKQAVAATAVLVAAVCLVLTHRQLGYWSSDITLFSHALAVTPDNDTARIDLGGAYQRAGEKSEVMAQYRRALQINPDNAQAHNNLANVLDDAGHPDEALAEYQAALRLQPSLPDAHNNLGSLYVELGRFDEAKEQYNEAAQLDPEDWHAPYLMGKALLKQGRDADAVPYLQHACELAPDNSHVLNFASQVFASDENPGIRDGRLALALATQADDMTSGAQPDVLDTLAMAYAETGQFQQAQTAARAAVQIVTDLGLTNEVEEISARLQLYEKNQAYRQSFISKPQTSPPKE